MHVIAAAPELLEPFPAWGFTRGMRPDPAHAAASDGRVPRLVPQRLQRPGQGGRRRRRAMIVRVECYAGHRGEATPRRLLLEHRAVALVELLDCWLAPDNRYFKLRGADGATYILRHDEPRGRWELTFYQAAPRSSSRCAAAR